MSQTLPTAETEEAASRAERDRVIATLFKAGERVWLVDETYDAVASTWRVALVRQRERGIWMRQRYHYDVPRGIVYFMGERPISEAELATLRRNGRRFNTSA